MEGLAVNRAVGEVVERPLDFPDATPNTCYLEALAREVEFGDELYGVKTALEYGIDSPELEQYLAVQETTHLQEGIELTQKDTTDFRFDGQFVRSQLNGEPMVKVAEDGYKAQQRLVKAGRGFEFMVVRTTHDIDIAADNDYRMKHSPVGSTWARCTPYAEEETDQDAAGAGFWPGPKRAFIWLYRKKDEQTLETTIVTIDDSAVAAFAVLAHEHGTDLPPTISSHDVPGHVIEFSNSCESEVERDNLVEVLKQQYRGYAQLLEPADASIGSKEFLEKYAQSEITLLVRLQQEILFSLENNELSPYTACATEAVLGQRFLDEAERRAIMKLYNTAHPRSHIEALKLIMKAHRYGAWESINQKVQNLKNSVPGSALIQQNRYINPPEIAIIHQTAIGQEVGRQEVIQVEKTAHSAQSAAEHGKIKPGCAGGSSFLSQSESEAKESIFGGKENDPKRWMSCPFCKKKEAVKARVCDTDLKCRHCEAEVKGGKVVNTGNGGKEPLKEFKVVPQHPAEVSESEKSRLEKSKSQGEAFKDVGKHKQVVEIVEHTLAA